MRPSISEQLRGTRRILIELIGPEVSSAYASDVLRGAVANLEMLEHAWPKVLAFLAWDNAGTATLLEQLAPHVATHLAERARAALAVTVDDPFDVDAQSARNDALRGVLADAIPELAAGDDRAATVLAAVRAHLVERVARYPLAMTGGLPAHR
ncbi:MAG TPA: hypothetical protein VGQ20_11080 [Acidimicrobiales bacterium]|jgi:hypothetical protein|nr:hypothetical protein [Acidimicrobiales bacterium]